MRDRRAQPILRATGGGVAPLRGPVCGEEPDCPPGHPAYDAASGGTAWMTLPRLLILIACAVLAAGVALTWLIVAVEDADGRALFFRELEKGLIQLALVVIAGAIIKFIFDRYQADQDRLAKERERQRQAHAAMVEFQTDKIRRLVEVSNKLRLAPALIEAHRSAKTYREQMLAAIDARLELHRIVHEIGIFGPLQSNTAFPRWESIRGKIGSMQDYLEGLEKEFRARFKSLSERQVEAEQKRELQAKVWNEICDLETIKDLLGLDQGRREDTEFYRKFVHPYSDALQLMQKDLAERQNLLAPTAAGASPPA